LFFINDFCIIKTIENLKTTANPEIKKADAVFSISRVNTTNLSDEQKHKTLQLVNLTFVFKASLQMLWNFALKRVLNFI